MSSTDNNSNIPETINTHTYASPAIVNNGKDKDKERYDDDVIMNDYSSNGVLSVQQKINQTNNQSNNQFNKQFNNQSNNQFDRMCDDVESIRNKINMSRRCGNLGISLDTNTDTLFSNSPPQQMYFDPSTHNSNNTSNFFDTSSHSVPYNYYNNVKDFNMYNMSTRWSNSGNIFTDSSYAPRIPNGDTYRWNTVVNQYTPQHRLMLEHIWNNFLANEKKQKDCKIETMWLDFIEKLETEKTEQLQKLGKKELRRLKELPVDLEYSWNEYYKKEKREASNMFVELCINDKDDIAQSYHNQNYHLIDVHHNYDQAFRNACLANNKNLINFIYKQGNVDIHACNDQAFHNVCLNQNQELAEWFRSLDKRYHFDVSVDKSDGKAKINILTCGFKDDKPKKELIDENVDNNIYTGEFNDEFDDDELQDFDVVDDNNTNDNESDNTDNTNDTDDTESEKNDNL